MGVARIHVGELHLGCCQLCHHRLLLAIIGCHQIAAHPATSPQQTGQTGGAGAQRELAAPPEVTSESARKPEGHEEVTLDQGERRRLGRRERTVPTTQE